MGPYTSNKGYLLVQLTSDSSTHGRGIEFLWSVTCPTATCTNCPSNQNSPAASSTCTCNAGFSGPNGGTCTQCGTGNYGTGGNNACQGCPDGSNSPAGSTAVSACVANAGYSGQNGGPITACTAGNYKSVTGTSTCKACEAGSYSAASGSSMCTLCLGGGSSYQGSTSANSCFGNVGFYGSNGGPFTPCPANSTSPAGSTSIVSCTCNSGFIKANFISPYSLTACARFVALMTWKPAFASVSTRNSPGIGSTEMPTYVAAGGPNGKGHLNFDRTKSQFLDAGSRTFNIQSNGGYTLVTVVRFPSTYTNMDRVFEAWSLTGRREEYLVRSYLSSTQYQMGFIWYDQGTMGPTVYSQAMSTSSNEWLTIVSTYQRSPNKYSLTVNGVTQTNTDPQVMRDKTVAGMYIGKSKWQTIALGFSSNAVLSADIAGLFVVDEYLNTDATAAIADAMRSGVDLTDTTCPRGNTCRIPIACNAGYAGPIGDPCTECAAGTFAVASSTVCTECPQNSTSPVSSTSINACVGNPGYTGSGAGPFPPCAVGTYKTLAGNQTCTNCGAGMYSTSVAATAAAVCTSCGAGTYSVVSATSTCTNCAAGKWSSMLGVSFDFYCVGCAPGSTSPGGSSNIGACVANAGYTGQGVIIDACTAGKFKAVSGSEACADCATGKYSATSAATACQTCPPNTQAPAGSTAMHACVADAGYSGSGLNVSMCVAGTFKATVGSEACAKCGAGKYTIGYTPHMCFFCTTGSVPNADSSACIANAGFFGNPIGPFTACGLGAYSSTTGATACTSCGPDTVTLSTGSASAAACVANAGYTGTGLNVTACVAGTYKLIPGSEACLDCIAGTYSVMIAAMSAHECKNCALGKYSAVLAATACQTCPQNTQVAFYGSTAIDACVANAGYFGQGNTVTPCPAGTFKFTSGSAAAACVNCPTGSTSPAASFHQVFCEATAGFFGNPSGPFTACSLGEYSSETGATACMSCGAGAVTLSTGSASAAACVCQSGFTNWTSQPQARRRLLEIDSQPPPPPPLFALAPASVEIMPPPPLHLQVATPPPPLQIRRPPPAPPVKSKPPVKWMPPPPLRELGSARPRRLLGLRSVLNATCEPCSSTHYKNTTGNDVCARCPDGMYSLDGLGCVFVPFNTTTTPMPTSTTPSPTTTAETTTPSPTTTAETTTAETTTPSPTTNADTTTPVPARRVSTTTDAQPDTMLVVIGVVSALLALGCGGAVLWLFCIRKRDRNDEDQDK